MKANLSRPQRESNIKVSLKCKKVRNRVPFVLLTTGVCANRSQSGSGRGHRLGTMAVQTSLNARDLPDNLKGIRTAIDTAVPHARTNHAGRGESGLRSEKKIDPASRAGN